MKTLKNSNKISIIIPILNEGKNILKLTNKIKKNLIKFNFEIIYVDDSSTDNSVQVLKNLEKKYNFFKPIFRNKKRDLTKSCFIGIEKAKFDSILIMDGDLQHDPKYIPKMFELHRKGYDVVIGTRNLMLRKNLGLSEIRRYASVILIFLFKIFNIKTKDPMSGYFLFKKKIYLKNKQFYFGKGFKILADILINSKNNLKTTDYNIVFKRRHENESKMSLKILLILIQFYLKSILRKLFI